MTTASSASDGAASMDASAWARHVAGVLLDPAAHSRLVAAPARRPFAGARRHMLVDLEAQEADAEVEAALLDGFESLRGRGSRVSDGQNAANYLPARLIAEGLAPGLSLATLERAMHRLLAGGVLVRVVVGRYGSGLPKHVLQLAIDDTHASGSHAPSAGHDSTSCGAPAAIPS